MYGDEIDNDEDRNDGLNALVIYLSFIFYIIVIYIIFRISNG